MEQTPAAELGAFIEASPSPFHAVETVLTALRAAGFAVLAETDEWPAGPGRYVVAREGSVVAWSTEHLADAPRGSAGPGLPGGPGRATPYRVIGAHTDSPNLRVRPQPDLTRYGWDQLSLEVYGGPLLNSWLDRDLGLSGRVVVRDPDAPHGVGTRLWRYDEPLLRIPQLAIHLDRGVTESGLTLNPQTQLVPVWGATGAAPAFDDWLAERLDVPAADVLGWDLMTHDLTAPAVLGRTGDLFAAPRLDNLASCWAATRALIQAVRAAETGDPGAGGGAGRGRTAGDSATPYVPVVALFDHEEVGSTTNRGADSQLLPAVLERIVLAGGGDRQDALRALAGSLVCSADMAHAVHPNYADRSEPTHQLFLGHGPVVKVNGKARYASDATGVAAIRLASERAGVPLQQFVSRGDMPCGSTIGPMTAALTGAVTVDVGAPMLSMHSARELTGVADVAAYAALLAAFLEPAG